MTDETNWLRDRLLEQGERLHNIDKDMAVQKVLQGKAPDDADLDKLEAKIGREMRQFADAGKAYTDTSISRAIDTLHAETERQNAELRAGFRSDLKEFGGMLSERNAAAEKETRRKIIRYGIIFAGVLTSLITAIMSGAPADFFRSAGHFMGAF